MFALRAKLLAHPSKSGQRVLDAAPMLRGENLMQRAAVSKEYVGILDRVVAKAITDGELTEKQSKAGLWTAFKTPAGALFLSVSATDGSGVVIGTSVPSGAWWIKQ
jgi:hypothetical protein